MAFTLNAVVAPGDEVMGWSDRRSAQADHVVSDRQHLTAKPRALIAKFVPNFARYQLAETRAEQAKTAT